MNEWLSYRILYMLSHGFKKIDVMCNSLMCTTNSGTTTNYPLTWIENDYIFYKKICK